MKRFSISLLLLCLLLLGGCGPKDAQEGDSDLSAGNPASSLGTGVENEAADDAGGAQQAPDQGTPTANTPTPTAPKAPTAPPVQGGGAGARAETPAAVPALTATVSISTANAKGDILAAEAFGFTEGETAFDLLLRLTKDKGIQMDFSGSKTSAYVKAINNLYEFDKGPSSGWLYFIGGQSPDVSAATYKLKDGDVIAWKYIEDFSKALGPDDV